MKKIGIKTIWITILIIFIMILSCEKDDSKVELLNIFVKSSPTKVNYCVTDTLDLSGLVVELVMSNSDTIDVAFNDFSSYDLTCFPINGTILSESTNIEITHLSSGKFIKQYVSVSDDITSISIKSPPAKASYYISEELDLSGLEITLTMNNGALKELPLSSFEKFGIICKPENGIKLTKGMTNLVISYGSTNINTIQSNILKTIVDADSNIYHLVKIGNQIWMAENLKTTKYNNGDDIPTTTPSTIDITLEDLQQYQWSYAGDDLNIDAYGKLYTWHAIMDSRNVCPTGWHVSTHAEWDVLTSYIGGMWVAGGKLKEVGTEHWTEPNKNATDIYGFTAVAGGYRVFDGEFSSINWAGFWWTATGTSPTEAYARAMYSLTGDIGTYYANKSNGYSVRCVED